MQDEKLVEEIQKGNNYSFNLLVWKWEKRIYNLAVRMLNSEEEASDACQDIFITAYEKIKSFKGKSKFSTWLYRIAINKCISKLRHRKVEDKYIYKDNLQLNSLEKLPINYDNETKIEKKQLNERIMKLINSLPEEQKAILELKIFQDLSFEEISLITGLPVGTAKSRMHYALKKLRNELKEYI